MSLRTNASAPPRRILLGPGPSQVSDRVLAAMAAPTIGHLDPEYLAIMDETQRRLQAVFRTENQLTVAVPGTGSAGMEACIGNLIEPGDEMLVCVAGYFSNRICDIAERHGATVHRLELPWGEVCEPETLAAALEKHPRTKVVGIVHAETSTGAHQPLVEISHLVHASGTLLLVDAVTSLGGVELAVDEWGIDACYSCSQKCLASPPGLAPVTLSPAAVEKMNRRTAPVASWYLDLSLIAAYWGAERVYHHTAPVNLFYALLEALRIVEEEGLEARIARHTRNHHALRSGLEAIGLRYIPRRSLTVLNAVHAAPGADDAIVRRRLLDEYGIEIGAGLGPLRGKAWRVGLMGVSSTRSNVVLLLSALESILSDLGVGLDRGAAVASAMEAYARA